MKRILIVLLLAAQLLAAASCGGRADVKKPSDETGGVTEDTTAEVTTSFYDSIDIPDFSGKSFTILARTDLIDEMYAESETGEIVNDAVFKRNLNVADRLKIDLNVIDQPGDWANQGRFVKYVSSAIMSDDDSFQLIAGYMNYMPITILDGYYTDINTLPFINTSNSWWVKGFNDNVTINGRMYMAMGDLCSSMLRYAFCGYANTKLMKDNGYAAEDLYQAVRDGKWTFDMMTGMAKNVCADLDGDGKMTEDDLHGVGMHYMPVRALTNAFAIDYTKRDQNGLPEISLYGERLVEAYEKVAAAVNSEYWCYKGNTMNMFKEDRSLFFFTTLGTTNDLRDMKSGFAVVPMPKYDEAQDGYRTETVDTTSILLVPVTIREPELVGLALEALNYESQKLVTPAYFDIAMQSKYTRDEESKEMIQIVRDSIYFDFGYVFAGAIGGEINCIMESAMSDKGLASVWASNEDKMEKGLEKLLEFFAK